MRPQVTPDTYSSRMATYQSSGLKIQMDGRLSALFKGRESRDKSTFFFSFHFIK